MTGATFHESKWRRWFLLIWAGAAAWLLWQKWGAIHWFALGDTDDNLRFAQVRALLNGQGWYDLRQYRIDPPGGISVHWSRLVDLPIAGLLLLLKPLIGEAQAARWACAIAPLLALGRGPVRHHAGGAAAGPPLGLSARRLHPALRAERGRHVVAAPHRPSWLAARRP